jgi:hypothetical protein
LGCSVVTIPVSNHQRPLEKLSNGVEGNKWSIEEVGRFYTVQKPVNDIIVLVWKVLRIVLLLTGTEEVLGLE